MPRRARPVVIVVLLANAALGVVAFMVWRRHRTPLEHATVAEYRDFVQTRADRIVSAVAATNFGAPTSRMSSRR